MFHISLHCIGKIFLRKTGFVAKVLSATTLCCGIDWSTSRVMYAMIRNTHHNAGQILMAQCKIRKGMTFGGTFLFTSTELQAQCAMWCVFHALQYGKSIYCCLAVVQCSINILLPKNLMGFNVIKMQNNAAIQKTAMKWMHPMHFIDEEGYALSCNAIGFKCKCKALQQYNEMHFTHFIDEGGDTYFFVSS